MKHDCRSIVLAATLLGCIAFPANAQTTGPVQYDLQPATRYLEGCYDPCVCLTSYNVPVVGTFVLQYGFTDAAGFDHYAVSAVDWTFTTFVGYHVTGSGEYVRGGTGSIQHRLQLDLSANNDPPMHFDSGLVTPTVAFPSIDISINVNDLVCYDFVYNLVAEPDSAGTPFCAGDGTATACPCGNSGAVGNGCASSVNASGANLSGNGTASLAADSVVLQSSGTPDAPLLFFQGTQQVNGGAGAVFGDGLRCVGGTVRRLRTTLAAGGAAALPSGPADMPLSVLGGIAAPGTFDYQVWYRNSAQFCTSSTFNLSNGYEIVWLP